MKRIIIAIICCVCMCNDKSFGHGDPRLHSTNDTVNVTNLINEAVGILLNSTNKFTKEECESCYTEFILPENMVNQIMMRNVSFNIDELTGMKSYDGEIMNPYIFTNAANEKILSVEVVRTLFDESGFMMYRIITNYSKILDIQHVLNSTNNRIQHIDSE